MGVAAGEDQIVTGWRLCGRDRDRQQHRGRGKKNAPFHDDPCKRRLRGL
jgi:hypothetical protein